jgi:tRNA threonylcarbamoyl adenosine modification protein (Sua5/YciO/YrdC/YwlC family)
MRGVKHVPMLALTEAATALQQPGTVAVIPTDTVYGLVARASDQTAVRRLYQLKHREHKPGTLTAASLEQLVELGVPRRYLTAVAQFWPDPVSVVVPLGSKLAYLHLAKGDLAMRVPNDSAYAALLAHAGPLLTSSANHPGEPPASTIEQAKTYFGDQVDFYIDGGDLTGRQSSTVIRVVDDAIEVLRLGAADINQKSEIRNRASSSQTTNSEPRTPS